MKSSDIGIWEFSGFFNPMVCQEEKLEKCGSLKKNILCAEILNV